MLSSFEELKKLNPKYKNLTKKDLVKNIDLSLLHKGAKKAFKEAGIL